MFTIVSPISFKSIFLVSLHPHYLNILPTLLRSLLLFHQYLPLLFYFCLCFNNIYLSCLNLKFYFLSLRLLHNQKRKRWKFTSFPCINYLYFDYIFIFVWFSNFNEYEVPFPLKYGHNFKKYRGRM